MQNSARIGTNIEIGRPIVIGDTERRSGMYVLGRPGTGKTSLLVNLMTQDIANGHGLFFLDPHGDAIKDVLKGVDDNREGSIFVLNPADGRFTFGINLLACQDINSFNGRKDTYDRCRWVFEKVFATKEVWGPLLQLIIEYTLPVFIENQEFTLAEVPLFLRDQAFRNHLLHNVKYADESREFWEYEFPMRERDQQELVAPAQRRVRILLGDERVR